jgi:AAA15 family ATPase/GTPase
MLVQFKVKNFKSFRKEATLSMVASSSDSTTRLEDNTFLVEKFNLRLLKSLVIYGANASGKSKILDALSFMRRFVIESSKDGQIDEPIPVDPFRLSTSTINEPTSFEIVFIMNKTQYRYGFEVNKLEVVSEWLYRKVKTKEVEIFYRTYQEFETHRTQFKATDLIKNDRIRSNALFVSVAASFNDKISKEIVLWFRLFSMLSGIDHDRYEGYSVHRLKSENDKKETLNFLKAADFGIEDLNYIELDLDDLPNDMPDELKEFLKAQAKDKSNSEFLVNLSTLRQVYNEKNLPVRLEKFSIDEDESAGTRKYFAISGPILNTLSEGRSLVVDELANKLHSLLVCKIVELFNNSKYNTNNAQIIFTTHDTNLLSSGLFRRDQIWFTEKNRYGSSILYSLADFKTDVVRKSDNFEDKYIKGKYGAIPYLGDFNRVIEQFES